MIKKIVNQVLCFFYPLFKKFLTFQVYTYLVTGAVNTLLNMALFAASFYLLQSSKFVVEMATIIAFVITVFTGFWFSKNFTFSNSNNEVLQTKQFKKYTIVALQGQVNGYILTKLLIVFLLVKPVFAYIITAVIMLTLNYFLQKYYSFKVQAK